MTEASISIPTECQSDAAHGHATTESAHRVEAHGNSDALLQTALLIQSRNLANEATEAFACLHASTALDNATAMYHLSLCYRDGYGVEQNHKLFRSHLRTAAHRGYPPAQVLYAQVLTSSATAAVASKRARASLRLLRRASKQNYAPALRGLAACYSDGLGVKPNKSKAIHLYSKAAAAGDTLSQYLVGEMYLSGEGLPSVDYPAAFRSFREAAAKGHVAASCKLAFCYLHGLGTPTSDRTAVHWLSTAITADGECPSLAYFLLGNCYLFGTGVAVDRPLGIHYLHQAADRNHAWAQRTLAECYERGTVVCKDLALASHFYELSDRGEE